MTRRLLLSAVLFLATVGWLALGGVVASVAHQPLPWLFGPVLAALVGILLWLAFMIVYDLATEWWDWMKER